MQKPNRTIIHEYLPASLLLVLFLWLLFKSSCMNVVKFRAKKACKESCHPPFKMLKATGLPAVMVCSEGECQSVRGEKRKNSIFMPRAQKGTPPVRINERHASEKGSQNMTDLNTLLIFMLGILHLILHMPKDCFVFLFVWPLGSILFMLHTDIKRRGCWFWVLWRFKTRLTSSHRSWWIGLSKIGKGHPVSRSPFWKCTQILISRIFMEG